MALLQGVECASKLKASVCCGSWCDGFAASSSRTDQGRSGVAGMQVSMSGQRVMDRLNVSLGILAAFFAVPVTLVAATPRPLTAQTPVIVLLPQIEELEPTPGTGGASVPTAPTVEKPAGRESFPPARQFWKRWRSGSESRATTAVENSPAVPPEPRREVVTISDLQLEPFPQTTAPVQQPIQALPEMQRPMPVLPSRTGPPPADLILPSPETASVPCEAHCDQQLAESSPHTVAPRSLKMGKGLRFPYLSNLFH